jgi:predicted PurR-regulated permease PerM
MKDAKTRPGGDRRQAAAADSDREELRSSATVIGVVVALAIFIYLVRDILLPFVFAGILAYVCTPLVNWLTAHTRWPRWLFAVAVLLALTGLAALVAFLGWRPLLHEAWRTAADLQGRVEALLRQFMGDRSFKLLGDTIDAARIATSVSDGVRDWFSTRGSMLSALVYSFAGMFAFILSWVLLGYFLIDAPRISEGLFWLVPPHHRPFIHRVWNDLNPVLRRYFIGFVLVVLYAAIFAYIGLGLFLHLHHAVFLALLTGVLEVIPIFGPFASAAIAGLVAVREAARASDIIAYVIYAVLLRVSIDEFYGPIVLGKAAYIRPVMVIFCFVAGAVLFGIVGIVLAVPVALAVKISLYELYKEEGQGKSG